MNYSDKLKHPLWQKKRLEILNRDEWTCLKCGSKEKTLHVHHKLYSGNDPWEIKNEHLITLCCDCHNYETSEIDNAIYALTYAVKEKFLAHEIINIATGFWNIKNLPLPKDFTLSLIHWLVTPELNEEMVKRSSEWIEQHRSEIEERPTSQQNNETDSDDF